MSEHNYNMQTVLATAALEIGAAIRRTVNTDEGSMDVIMVPDDHTTSKGKWTRGTLQRVYHKALEILLGDEPSTDPATLAGMDLSEIRKAAGLNTAVFKHNRQRIVLWILSD